ncbi:hypothetical protein DM02DRAFT_707464, partial [Periconia macrospinosa]
MDGCRHTFCLACLRECYTLYIKSGELDNVTCQAIDCGAELLAPRDLVRIIPKRELVQRFADIKRKRFLETDRATVFCPQLWCQGAAMGSNCLKPSMAKINDVSKYLNKKTRGRTLEFWILPYSEKTLILRKKFGDWLKVREDCAFAFCKACKRTWHGENVHCWR